MASPPPPQDTRTPSAPPSGGIDLGTLVITALASASAAFLCSKIWAPGTLVSAAFTPVIVALIKEALRKPTDLVLATVPVAATTRRRTREQAVALPGEPLEGGTPPPLPPPAAVPGGAPVRIYSTRARRLRWRLALITGLLGFAICVVAFTVPELLSGHSLGSSGRATTILGGHRHRASAKHQATTTPATSTAARTTTITRVTVTSTVPAQTTPTTPTTATTPTPTPTPTVATTTPQAAPPAATTPDAGATQPAP